LNETDAGAWRGAGAGAGASAGTEKDLVQRRWLRPDHALSCLHDPLGCLSYLANKAKTTSDDMANADDPNNHEHKDPDCNAKQPPRSKMRCAFVVTMSDHLSSNHSRHEVGQVHLELAQHARSIESRHIYTLNVCTQLQCSPCRHNQSVLSAQVAWSLSWDSTPTMERASRAIAASSQSSRPAGAGLYTSASPQRLRGVVTSVDHARFSVQSHSEVFSLVEITTALCGDLKNWGLVSGDRRRCTARDARGVTTTTGGASENRSMATG